MRSGAVMSLEASSHLGGPALLLASEVLAEAHFGRASGGFASPAEETVTPGGSMRLESLPLSHCPQITMKMTVDDWTPDVQAPQYKREVSIHWKESLTGS